MLPHHAIQDFSRLGPRQYYRYAYWPFRTDDFVQKRQVYFQDFLVKKKQGTKRLVLCGRRDFTASSKIGKKGLNLGGTEFAWWSITVVLYESLDPL